MIRAAAKNHAFAAVVVAPESLRRGARRAARRPTACCRSPTRESLAAEAFAYTARYDTAIARWFAERRATTSRSCSCAPSRRSSTCPTARTRTSAPPTTSRSARARACSRRCASTTASSSRSTTCSTSTRRARLVRDFDGPGVRDRQAQQPVRRGRRPATPLEAYRAAFACDPLSAFGGVIALNRRVDRATAEALAEQFVEVLFAPGYDDDALEVLHAQAERAHPRGRGAPRAADAASSTCARSPAGCSSRTATASSTTASRWRSSPSASPTEREWGDLLFAWRVCRHVQVQRDRARARRRRSASAPGR